ncbi:MAG TPA: VIT1/CCC1 transporter family protein [Capsulimonadaceae bacterium]|jgi:VIT1/CCC1 family predicted Fe2+/Mn2+ transporter/bacterioferritin (cytochrome b1)
MNTDSTNRKLIESLQDNWRNEIVIAHTYRKLAEMETDERRKGLLLRMAENEEHHAELWRERLAELGAEVDMSSIDREVRAQARFARMFGTMASIRRIEKEERGHVNHYTEQVTQLGDSRSAEILRGIIPDEQAHADRLAQMASEPKTSNPRASLDRMMAGEKWHLTHTGGWLGDAIYGANDGLGAVFGIVSGMAGATMNNAGLSHTILLAGIAGTLASALSMGSGAYLATKSEREVHEAEIKREKREIEMDPEHEREELELIYQLKGFSEDEAKLLADRICKDPDQFLATMASEELGISQTIQPNPLLSAGSATLSTAIGAFIPLIPFFFPIPIVQQVIWSAVISLAAHFAVGAAKTFVTGRSWLASGTEMTIVGVIEAAITYGIGLLLGAHVS